MKLKKKNNELSSFLNSSNMIFHLNGTLTLVKKNNNNKIILNKNKILFVKKYKKYNIKLLKIEKDVELIINKGVELNLETTELENNGKILNYGYLYFNSNNNINNGFIDNNHYIYSNSIIINNGRIDNKNNFKTNYIINKKTALIYNYSLILFDNIICNYGFFYNSINGKIFSMKSKDIKFINKHDAELVNNGFIKN